MHTAMITSQLRTLSIREAIYVILREAQYIQMNKSPPFGRLLQQKSRRLSLAFEDQCAGDHVMQRLLPVGTSRHNITNEQNDTGDDLSNTAKRRFAGVKSTAMRDSVNHL